ncbi:decaprenyl-phosphate phosphoribosyltransferase [Phaeacidiphilus oryzae]|uniref:decaprenyl-phosphate phosphoribosyltransferase n=1 Tax=Phaeacidiphilus oryzae TaxID=348818 RepID=UPI000A050AC0|nr:decaprenyl-phosphate phosphoribosyltransferase [Phaeacidiphilus oryzae]
MVEHASAATLEDDRPPGAQGGASPLPHGATLLGDPLALAGGLVRTARPRQWVKNLLVVAAPAAAGQLFSVTVGLRLALIFVLFTAAASAVYLINDAKDVHADRAHPEKRHRPVASGQVPVTVAYGAGAALALAALTAATAACNPATALVVGVYLAMQFLYCTSLKHILVVDLVVVASGFLLRAMVGGLATEIPLSRWFLITTGFGALFMVAAKRYSERMLMDGQGGRSRALLAQYSDGYLRFVWQLAAGVAVLSYCLWALGATGSIDSAPVPVPAGESLPWRQLSIVPFVLAVLRYAVFADRGSAGSPEDVVLGDRPLMVIGAAWTVLYGLAVVGL